MAADLAAADPEADEGFMCGNCQRGRCARCNDPRCTCCYGGDPEPWPAASGLVARLLRRLRGPIMPCPA